MIDFKKKLNQKRIEKKIIPEDIYDMLDRRSDTGPLRPTQKSILEKWTNECRDNKDLIIKLHTGEGKTLIGLLILQSRINSESGPCIYICPNKYLAEQVCKEALKFGVPYCTLTNENNLPNEFVSGQKLLITHAQKLFNGKSIFGTKNSFTKADTVILDDSHACVEVIKNANTISISKSANPELYNRILDTFEESLRDQREGSFIEIKNGESDTFLHVPYWSWQDKKSDILQLLSDNNSDIQIKFTWPLLKDNIENYGCYISAKQIEIAPYNPSVRAFGTFNNANHRILMSATTQDDSFFIKGLSFGVDAVNNPLINEHQIWSGEKMVIIPSLINDEYDRRFIITQFTKWKLTNYGIVALVPSTKISDLYKNQGANIADKSNISNEIEQLKIGKYNKLTVFNNRYDGIDLPDASCRILIVDSMPYFESLSDKYEEECRPNSDIINKRLAQKIEQGLGRGVRGEKDYCVVLIIGTDLVNFIRNTSTNKFFSEQTRMQIKIGEEIARLASDEVNHEVASMQAVKSLINQSLSRDEGWKDYYSSEMNQISNDRISASLYKRCEIEKKVDQLLEQGEIQKACNLMQNLIDTMPQSDSLEKGWYLQQLARYKYPIAKIESVSLQQKAFKLNRELLKPIDGISYEKVSYINENQLNRIKTFLNNHNDYKSLKLYIESELNNLSFGFNSNKFEQALKNIGELLGFISQRPDQEYGKGPDNLWCGNKNHYYMFECKNDVKLDRKEISKKESGQMNNHCGWFDQNYGKNEIIKRFLIINTLTLASNANFSHEINIIRKKNLEDFKKNIKHFIQELSLYDLADLTKETIINFLEKYKLRQEDIENYSEKPQSKNNYL